MLEMHILSGGSWALGIHLCKTMIYIRSCVHFKSFIRKKKKKESRIYEQQRFQQCSEWADLTMLISLSSKGSGDLHWLYEYKIESFTFSAVKT